MFNLIDNNIVEIHLEISKKEYKNTLDENSKIMYKKIPCLDENGEPITIKRPKIADPVTMICILDDTGEVIMEDISVFMNGDAIVEITEYEMTEEELQDEKKSFINNKVAILEAKSKPIITGIRELLDDENLGIIELADPDKQTIKDLKLSMKNVIINCDENTEINDPSFYQGLPDVLQNYIKGEI